MDDERDDWPEEEEDAGDDDAVERDTVDGNACDWLTSAVPTREGPGYRVYTLMPRTSFRWDFIDEGGQLSFDVGFPIDVVGTPEVIVVLRVHAINGTTGVAKLVLEGCSRSDEDPEITYVDTVRLAQIRVGPGATAGSSLVARARCDASPLIRATIVIDQITRSSDGMTLSAELIARASDPGGCSCRTAR